MKQLQCWNPSDRGQERINALKTVSILKNKELFFVLLLFYFYDLVQSVRL